MLYLQPPTLGVKAIPRHRVAEGRTNNSPPIQLEGHLEDLQMGAGLRLLPILYNRIISHSSK